MVTYVDCCCGWGVKNSPPIYSPIPVRLSTRIIIALPGSFPWVFSLDLTSDLLQATKFPRVNAVVYTFALIPSVMPYVDH